MPPAISLDKTETVDLSTKVGAELRRQLIGLKNQEKNLENILAHVKGILRAMQHVNFK